MMKLEIRNRDTMRDEAGYKSWFFPSSQLCHTFAVLFVNFYIFMLLGFWTHLLTPASLLIASRLVRCSVWSAIEEWLTVVYELSVISSIDFRHQRVKYLLSFTKETHSTAPTSPSTSSTTKVRQIRFLPPLSICHGSSRSLRHPSMRI